MVKWDRLLLFLGASVIGLVPTGITAIDIPEGCIVKYKLEVAPVNYDTVDFHLYYSPSELSDQGKKPLNVRLTCESSHMNFDTLILTKNEVSLEKNRNGIKSVEKYSCKQPSSENGWVDLSLSIVGNYSLKDGQGQSLISSHIPVDCQHVKKVEIEGPYLMKNCHGDMPAWKIEGTEGKTVPLLSSKDDIKEDIILFSNKKFTPKIKTGGIEFAVGWQNNELVIKESTDVGQLPAFTQHLVMLLINEGSHTRLKILDQSRELYSSVLLTKPTQIHISEQNGGSFFFMQRRRLDRGDSCQNGHLMGDSIVWGLVGALTVVLVLLFWVLAFAFFKFRQQTSKISGRLESMYLEPRQGKTPPRPRTLPPSVLAAHREEAIYEEVDESFLNSLEKRKTRGQSLKEKDVGKCHRSSTKVTRKIFMEFDLQKKEEEDGSMAYEKNTMERPTSQHSDFDDEKESYEASTNGHVYLNMNLVAAPQVRDG